MELICIVLGVDYCGFWEFLFNCFVLVFCVGDGWDKVLVGNYIIDVINCFYVGYII